MSAILGRRRVRMRYHSFSSQQIKDYIVEPYRLAYAQGGLYLQAFVPDYSEMRTFAVQRIEQAVALEESFNPVAERRGRSVPAFTRRVFGNAGTGRDRVHRRRGALRARARVSRVAAIEDLPGGRIRLTMNVVIDWELQAWVMGFGPAATVIQPRGVREADRREPRRNARDLLEDRIGIDRGPLPPLLFVGRA